MKRHPRIGTVRRTTEPEADLFVETLFRGFNQCREAEEHLADCVSDRDLELAREQLLHVELQLQQALDDYVDARVRRGASTH